MTILEFIVSMAARLYNRRDSAKVLGFRKGQMGWRGLCLRVSRFGMSYAPFSALSKQ